MLPTARSHGAKLTAKVRSQESSMGNWKYIGVGRSNALPVNGKTRSCLAMLANRSTYRPALESRRWTESVAVLKNASWTRWHLISRGRRGARADPSRFLCQPCRRQARWVTPFSPLPGGCKSRVVAGATRFWDARSAAAVRPAVSPIPFC